MYLTWTGMVLCMNHKFHVAAKHVYVRENLSKNTQITNYYFVCDFYFDLPIVLWE